MINIAEMIGRFIRAYWLDHVRLGTVTGTSGGRVFVRWPGQDSPEPRSFARLASYSSPSTGHEVLCLKTSTGRRSDWIVLGKVER